MSLVSFIAFYPNKLCLDIYWHYLPSIEVRSCFLKNSYGYPIVNVYKRLKTLKKR